MRSTNCQFVSTNALRELRRLWSEGHWRCVEPLRRDCDVTRNGIHAGDAPSHQRHQATGTTDRTPSAIAGVRGRSAVPQSIKTEIRAEAHGLRTVACPLGSMRGLNQSPSRSRIPASPSRRACAPVMTGEAPSARTASVSLRSRTSRGARGRAVPTPVSIDRTRGNDAGTEPAPVLMGTTEGTKRCPDFSTAYN